MNDNFYSLYSVECEALGVLLESMTMIKGRFGPNFSRFRFYKVMSLALNANVANTMESRIIPSFYIKDIYFNFKENYENKDEIKAAIKYCEEFSTKTCMNTDLKLINYLTFSEYTSFLGAPNDILDSATVARGVSPYVYELYTDNKPTFDYEMPKDDPFINFLGPAVVNKRKIACVKPMELDTKEYKEATLDPISEVDKEDAEKFLQHIEANFVIEQEKLDFLLDTALLQWNAFEKVWSVLETAGYKKNDNTLAAYKAIVGAASMRKAIHEWKIDYISKKNTFTTTVLDAILPYMGKLQSEALIQSVVFLAHGVITPANIKGLAAKYGLDYGLVNAFFISGCPSELL